jgi:hypothetical protein
MYQLPPVIPDAQRSGIQLLGLEFNFRDYSWRGGLLDTGSEPAPAYEPGAGMTTLGKMATRYPRHPGGSINQAIAAECHRLTQQQSAFRISPKAGLQSQYAQG